MERNLLKLLLKTVYRPVIASSIRSAILLIIMNLHIAQEIAPCSFISLNAGELAAIARLVKDRIIDTVHCLADCEGKRASHCDLADALILNRLKIGRMVPLFTVSNADLAVLVRPPDNYLVLLIDDSDESAADMDTPDTYVVVQLDFPRSFELTKDARAPYVHHSLLSNSCARMPSRDLLEIM